MLIPYSVLQNAFTVHSDSKRKRKGPKGASHMM